MRKFLVISFLLITSLAGATNYYVKNGGSDAANGLTDGTAWETLSKVSGFAFSAGDTIFFNKGDTFRGLLYNQHSGSAIGGRIVYDAYGTGAKPKILGAVDRSLEADWEVHSGNVWKTTATVGTANDAGNVIFNNEALCGVKRVSIAACTVQGYWYLNPTDDLIYLYSVGNPGAFYTHIEIGGVYSENLVSFRFYDYWTIRNLDLRYSGNNLIFCEGSDYITIENCDLSWGGGWFFMGGPDRMGNGVQIWVGNTNITVRYNKINNIYDAGISPQGSGTYTQTNILIYYNIISNCYYSYEWFTRSGATITNHDFLNNTCYEAGGSWSESQLLGRGEEEHLRNVLDGATISGCEIKNNIFCGSTTRGLHTYLTSGLTMNYNLFYDLPVVGKFITTSYTTLANWIAGTIYDDNSVAGDPLFTTPGSDYTLQVGSPAIDVGVGVGLTLDYAGNIVGDDPDIGSYEYNGSPPTPPPNLPAITTDFTYNWSTGVKCGGSGINDGGGTITAKGVCYSTSANPTTANDKISGGTGTDTFWLRIIGLALNTTYHIRAYCTNAEGTAYGADYEFTTSDRPSNVHGSSGKIVHGSSGKIVIDD